MAGADRRAWWSWASIVLLAVLCGVLIILQYRWTGEVARAERERLKSSLDATLARFSQDFNSELSSAGAELFARDAEIEAEGVEPAYARRYARWRESARDPLFSRVALAVPDRGKVALRMLDPQTQRFRPAEWPETWAGMRDWLTSRIHREGPGRGGPGPGPVGRGGPWPAMFRRDDSPLIEIPRMGPPPKNEQEWLVLEIDLGVVRSSVFPRLIQRHLSGAGGPEYDVEVVSRFDPEKVIFGTGPRIGEQADASAAIFDFDFAGPGRRIFLGLRTAIKGARGPGPGPELARGRWEILARHRAGSLEAIVERVRWRNLAVSGAILLLMVATVVALVRFSRKAHELAELQMNFVAGVSHELRTPLTVIRTAAFNLRGKVAGNPAQVERYGALIQNESEKLTELVEQVLRFAGTGRAPERRERVSIENAIEQGLGSNGENPGGPVVETAIEPGLPAVIGDPVAIEHAIRNLIDNARKYGSEAGWIGVRAARAGGEVEIRVTDRGPGIPRDEQDRIFDPFFRGRRALADQVHGTGLGLNLVKRIVEAHGGSVAVRSEPGEGTEFVVRIPAAPVEQANEFEHIAG